MPRNGLTFRDLRNAILFAALVYLALTFIRQIVNVLLMLSITALLVTSLSPAVTWFQSHRLPRWAGTGILVLALLMLIAILLYSVLPIASNQLSQLAENRGELIEAAEKWYGHTAYKYPIVTRVIPRIDGSTVSRFGSSFLGGITWITTSTAYLIAAALVIFVSTIYTLVNPKPLADGFLEAFQPEYRQRVLNAADKLAVQIRAWARGTVFAMLAIFALSWIALTLLGFKQALLFAVIAGLLELVPIIGPILSAVPPIIVALVTNPILALWVAGVFTLIQQFENHVLIPMVMSREVNLHPVTVIFWALVMGGLYGIIGVFLATPTAVVAGILYHELYLCEYQKQCSIEQEENKEDETDDKTANRADQSPD